MTNMQPATPKAKKPAGFKDRRRKFVKRNGKRLFQYLGRVMGRQSKVGDTPILPTGHFPFLEPFTANWEKIREEAQAILRYRDEIPAFHEISPDQHKISKGKNWRTFILYGFGQKLEKNCKQAPFTADLLSKVPTIQTAWFSILSPGYHIPPHTGVTKGIIRAHLGLMIPKQADKCWIRVGDKRMVWRPGEIFVFDDTYEHEVWNDTPDERVILLFDFDRPMRFWGRVLNKTFVNLLKLTAYYQEPKKNMVSFEDRFEAATRRANENIEKLSD